MALISPKCGAVNPDNARFCANSIQDLLLLIEQNWDESKRSLYSDAFATWFASIGRGDLTLAAKDIDIVQCNQDQDMGLRKLLCAWHLEEHCISFKTVSIPSIPSQKVALPEQNASP